MISNVVYKDGYFVYEPVKGPKRTYPSINAIMCFEYKDHSQEDRLAIHTQLQRLKVEFRVIKHEVPESLKK